MGVLDTIFKPLSYLGKNLPGNTQAGTWNVLPAVLSTWSNLIALNNQVSNDTFALYQKQAKDYVETAKRNARLIENKGAIELRRLEYQEKLERSNDVLHVAASGSNIGGTHLDVVVRKEKIRKMDEMALRANYTIQAMMELDNSYRQAAQVYGAMYQNARNVKWGVLNAILKGFETYTSLTNRDMQVQNNLAAAKGQMVAEDTLKNANLDYLYNGTVPIRTNPNIATNNTVTTLPDSINLNNIDMTRFSGNMYDYVDNNIIHSNSKIDTNVPIV